MIAGTVSLRHFYSQIRSLPEGRGHQPRFAERRRSKDRC